MKDKELDHIIEQSFRSEPDFHLALNFSQKVTKELIRRSNWKTYLSEYLNITAFLLFLLGVVAGIYYFDDKEVVLITITFISHNIIPLGFIVLLLNFVFFADRVLLPLLFERWKTHE